ncbi:hypothetical protein BST36_24660 [Mycolicibacterium moriokaense]|uniref:Transmembrane protein n=1 Tax=Mycolicibacterium moriokaense TaxID=39691 RepID=A0AAD1HHA2_9MYCO|nr:hypothetical protein [Mycolicibacterium moriokaense]MCV7042277.1 hypothetical protein [Mycolicibacterium moriokaense]ORB17600.1 hypothetical protein BST36_24660 [Mycolicibacterium moriokaense]BBX05051.1 hypothetical protein MMOR_59870 [Mycolicibacterium moriokaense]
METTLAASVRPFVLVDEPPPPPSIPLTQRYWPRLAFVGALAFGAYAFAIAEVIGHALTGSRAILLVVLPIHMAVIATGYRQPPRGISDGESDWIVAVLVGILGFTGLHLLQHRTPTLATLWQLNLFGVILWTACLFAIMLGVRYVVQMWQMWLFALCCVSPLPFLMTAAAFGGSDTTIALLTAVVGAVAVFLAGRRAPLGHRTLATLVCLATAVALTLMLGDHLSLAATVVLVAGIVPVIVTVVMLLRAGANHETTMTTTRPNLPRRSPLSLVPLVLMAVALLVVNPPHARGMDATQAAADWVQRAGLGAPETFPFITRFAGHDATLVRYTVPAAAGMPAAAVDVLTARQPSTLRDLDHMVWYPSSRPLEYQSATGEAMPAGARIIHSNADATTDANAVDWYAVTWLWDTGTAHQRVTVIVNQAPNTDAPPPTPQELSFLDMSLKPALWLARQQPDGTGQVDPLVVERADQVIELLKNSSGPEPPSDTGV